ncbi:hydroxymethylbilane synthase [Sulfolobales archaeon SCGC AB-777_J03]|nr:hydroxymethylbilane synthase [Sulfolobales archaeon SCGC AB-777_J03]
MVKLRIAARESLLSRVQVEMVARRLHELGVETEFVGVKTRADFFQDRPLQSLGKGVFEKEVNLAVIAGQADLAVHSMKDLPSQIDERLTIAAVLPRDPPYDVLVSHKPLESLPLNSVVGTSSIRRENFLKAYRNDLQVKLLRGNVDTRIKKWREGLYDAIVLAESSITRLKLDVPYHRIDPHLMVPEPTQGIVAVVTRRDRTELLKLLKEISDERTFMEATFERQTAAEMGAGCHVPLGVLFRVEDDGVSGIAGISDGRKKVVVEREFRVNEPEPGKVLARELRRAMSNEGVVLKA